MRSHRSFVLSLVIATSFTLLAVACSGNYSDSSPAGPSAVGGAALSAGGATMGGGGVSLAASESDKSEKSKKSEKSDKSDKEDNPPPPSAATCPCADSFASAVFQWESQVADPLVGFLDDQIPEESLQCTQEIEDPDPLDPDLGSSIDVSVAFSPANFPEDNACVIQLTIFGVDDPEVFIPVTTATEFDACAEIVRTICTL